jgi:dihydrofolate reductase
MSVRLTLHAFLTLDGVVQSPGDPNEDPDGPFEYGGWQFAYGDEEVGAAVVGWLQNAEAFLLGRKTYQIFSGYWPNITDPDNPVATKLNALPKHVASTTLVSVEWAHSSLLGADVPAEVARLKAQPGGELQVHGSGGLARTLIDHDLVDEYRLLHYPLHLGAGKRLFQSGIRAGALRLVSSATTRAGVVIATYETAGPVRLGSSAKPT